jgi:myxalamid-type polyketide synthase MxaE and MxaD
LGDIGLRIAHAMVDAGARRLVLLGRTPLPARAEWNSIDGQSRIGRRVNAVRALEAKGAAVHILTADVGDANELARALDGYAREAWPAIRGIVHAAGLLDNRLADTMDRATFDRVVNPKLNGALHLDRLLPDVDLFVLFSSTGGFLVQPGQANYAAANAGLDGLAHDRRARGKHALSIAWGVWAGLGLVSGGTAERNVEEMSRQGIKAFSADQGVALFHWLLRRNEAMVTVLPVVWSEFRRARAGRGSSVFRRQLEGANGEHDPSSNVAASLRRAQTPLERRRVIDGVLRDAAARVLRLPPSRLDARRPLGSVGLDSLMALELRNRLQATLERSLPATLLWNYPTLDALGDYLSDEPAPGQAVPSPGVSAPAVAIAVADVSQMSDDDAAKALRAPRQRGRSV